MSAVESPEKRQRTVAKYVFIGVVLLALGAIISALVDAAGGTDLPRRLLG